MLALPSLLPLAIKYASKLGRIHLAEKLSELSPQFEEKEKESEKYDENEAARDLLLSTPTTSGNLIRSNQEKNSTPSVVPVTIKINHFILITKSSILLFFSFCIQKPLSISQLKRNPFKKTPTSSGKGVASAFKHLTDNALGFDSQESKTSSPGSSSVTTNGTSNGTQGKENVNGNSGDGSVCTLNTFMQVKNFNISIFNSCSRRQSLNLFPGSKKTKLN